MNVFRPTGFDALALLLAAVPRDEDQRPSAGVRAGIGEVHRDDWIAAALPGVGRRGHQAGEKAGQRGSKTVFWNEPRFIGRRSALAVWGWFCSPASAPCGCGKMAMARASAASAGWGNSARFEKPGPP